MRVTVGVSGGIAAYKAAELVRALQRQALEVHVVMTAAAQKFVQPLTFAALTGHKVITSLWDESGRGRYGAPSRTASSTSARRNGPMRWWSLRPRPTSWPSLPTASPTIFLPPCTWPRTAPVLVAPAMNVNMWNHPATQANLEILRQRGVRVVEPGTGDLACGMVGAGRMAEPEAIADAVLSALGRRHDLAGEVVLVTAGGTREALDPVRFHRQPLQRQDGLRAGRGRAEPRREGDSHQRALGAASAGALRTGQGHHRRRDARARCWSA